MEYITGQTMNYDWGKPLETSEVARLSKITNENVAEKYAELWLGTHHKGPSTVMGIPLNEYITNNNLCSKDELEKYESFKDGQLPFLFKVLSINKALSIQAHPDKKLAEHLHLTDPINYPDSNHKPEMIIALSDCKALCQFRKLNDIVEMINCLPYLQKILDVEANTIKIPRNIIERKKLLKELFTKLMIAEPKLIKKSIKILKHEKFTMKVKRYIKTAHNLAKKLAKEFSYDVGCLCPFFLNIIELYPNQSLFLGPNEPHAYLSGDAIECMAASDNTVRAGLTQKYRDIDTLLNMLTYNEGLPTIIEAIENKEYYLYQPPVSDFCVSYINVESYQSKLSEKIDRTSLILIVNGLGGVQTDDDYFELKPGVSFIVPANCCLKWLAYEELDIWRATIAL